MNSAERFFLPENQPISDLSHTICHLYICGYMNEVQSLVFNHLFQSLQSITIGCHCFVEAREFVIDSVSCLELVKIGYECFNIDEEEREDGFFRIHNCPTLSHLEIGNNSFQDFKFFEVSHVNSLQSIRFGNTCFEYADCSLKGELSHWKCVGGGVDYELNWKQIHEERVWWWSWCRSSIIGNGYI